MPAAASRPIRRRTLLAAALWPASARADPPRLLRIGGAGAPLAAWVAPERGGELAGLALRVPGAEPRELLYRGRDYRETPGWSGRGPVLWPATGRNQAAAAVAGGDPDRGSWRHGDHTYPMPIHGFARDLPWTVESASGAAVRLVLADSAATRAAYPFGFRLRTTYAVRGTRLSMIQEVQASSANAAPMPFSIGNHITFRLPLAAGGDPGAVVVRTPARRRVVLDARGRPTGEVVHEPWAATPLRALAPRTAVALGGYPDPVARLWLEDPAGLTISLSHTADWRPAGDPVLFNLWGDVGAGFFSPEPWVGKQHSLATGDGLIWLSPGRRWRWRVDVAVEGAARS